MNDLIFETKDNTNIGGLIVALSIIFICLSLMHVVKTKRIKLTTSRIIAIMLALSCFVIACFIATTGSDTKIVYYEQSNNKTVTLSFNNFNSVMKEAYHYNFDLKENIYAPVNSQDYTVTNMKTNKQYNKCILNFKKLDNTNKIQLVDVKCNNNSIMKDIIKNK